MAKRKSFLLVMGVSGCLCWAVAGAVGTDRGGGGWDVPVLGRAAAAADVQRGRGGDRALADCSDMGVSGYSQPFDNMNFSTARISDEEPGLVAAEDLVNASGEVTPMLVAPVTQIRWWGISLEAVYQRPPQYPPVPVAACDQDDIAGTPFIFKFYTGGASDPGYAIATREAAPASIVDTGWTFWFGAPVMEYTATINPPVCNEDVTWISIQRKTGADADSGAMCIFLWIDEDLVGTYDDRAYQSDWPHVVETDQTICIGVFTGSTTGACCNESGWPYQLPEGPEIPNHGCAEGVDLCDCAEPGLRFSTGDCETGFSPACGSGACCYLDGAVRTCAEVTETECTTLGGYRFRIGEECPVDISSYCYPPPPNDTCATAIDYTGCPMTFDSTSAETDVLPTDPPMHLGDPPFQPQNDVYFKYQIPPADAYSPAYENGLVVITTYGSDFDTCAVCYRDTGGNDCPNFDCEGLQILDADIGQWQGVNDDMVSAERYTSIARVNVSEGGSSVKPGDCLLIRVAGLPPASSATPPGGQGTLRVDFLPYVGEQFDPTSVGVCCKTTGCEIVRSLTPGADCRAAGGWFRPYSDFLQGAAAPGYDNVAAGIGEVQQLNGCCATYPCEQGDFAGKAIALPTLVYNSPVSMTVNRHNVTYFKFQTPPVSSPPTAGVSIDTCGTPFDTILSIYRCDQPTDFDDAGDVHGDAEVGDEWTETPLFRNDNCYGVDPQASCFADPGTLASCMCLTVGVGEDLAPATWYVAKVGMKDERALESGYVRADGIDPVPNWPYDADVPVTITVTWHSECVVCVTDCCKGDLNNSEAADMADVPVFVDAVLRRGAFAGGLEHDQWEFCAADVNGDYAVDGRDIQPFMKTVLDGWDCTPDPINCEDEDPDYCQNRDGETFITSDLKTEGEDHYTVADNFSSLSGGYINHICWWGVFMTFDGGWTGDCGPGSGTFQITYYNDAGGIPGTIKAGPFLVMPTATQLDPLDFGTFTAYEYQLDASHPTISVDRDECVWVEIAADNGAGTCYFRWESAAPGDGVSYSDDDGDGYDLLDRQAGDLAFCVNALLNAYACLDVTCSPVCPGGAIIEGETGALDPCSNAGHVDTVNGGCDSNPTNPPMIDIGCGDVVCGTAGSWAVRDEVHRDTDWYKLNLAEQQSVTLMINAGDVDFPYVIGFVTGTNCNDPNLAIDPQVTGLPCQAAMVSACLPQGEHWIYFAPMQDVLIGCEQAYVFSVSCDDCPYCQQPSGIAAFTSDDATSGYRNRAADNFRPTEGGGVTSVTWYGVNMANLGDWVPCTFTNETYTIRYYLDDGDGYPGTLVAEHVIGSNFTKTYTGRAFDGAPLWEYKATHPAVPVNAGQCYWISIVQDAPNQSCMFRWRGNSAGAEGQGDGIMAQSGDDGATWTHGAAGGGELAFCIDVTAEAEGCGVDVAACCVDGDCIGDLNEYYCMMEGGTWHEGETCDTFACSPPVTCYTNSLTQNNNPNLLEAMPYSCRVEGEQHNLDNTFARSYTHSSRYVNCVHFGVWSTDNALIVMRTRIYKDATGGLPDNNMTLVAESQTPILPNTSNTFFTAYFSPSAYVESGGKAVYEHYYPESDANLFIGANTAGATNSTYHTYWKSPCYNDGAWIDMQNEDPEMYDWQLVQRVRWSTSQ